MEEECPLCYDSPLLRLICRRGHESCQECLDRQRENADECPFCREALLPEQEGDRAARETRRTNRLIERVYGPGNPQYYVDITVTPDGINRTHLVNRPQFNLQEQRDYDTLQQLVRADPPPPGMIGPMTLQEHIAHLAHGSRIRESLARQLAESERRRLENEQATEEFLRMVREGIAQEAEDAD